MLFNSFTFAVFLPVVFVLYWFVFQRNLKWQNIMLLVASYTFYGWWDWRFLSLIFISSVTDYLIGIKLNKTALTRQRKLWLYLSLLVNLGMLGFFKYYNFFAESLMLSAAKVGVALHEPSLNIILPVGISFYTFQTLSYTIDVYRKKIEPTKNMISFFAFVSFFPQLVAGPIERAKNLLPQFERTRTFSNTKAKDGLRQILNGLIKKVVIADVLAIEVDRIFSLPSFEGIPAMTLLLGAIYFAFQIYCDFSGYSDIAIGTARLFGFDLMQNFNFPFFSRNWGEFWNRWHISLSTWFRDYLYVPLGGSYGPKWKHARNILITFVVSGLWHGANWTFIVWGALCGILYLPTLFRKKQDKNMVDTTHNHLLTGLRALLQMASIFTLFALVMIIFRSASLELAWDYFIHLFSNIGLDTTLSFAVLKIKPLALILLLLVAEWLQRSKQHALQVDRLSTTIRWSIYLAALVLFLYFGEFNSDVQFIYFQF